MAELNSGDLQLLQCYNTSCGLKYSEDDNGDDVCLYHPGKPYFHDGYKEWTCCKMRSRDFTIFVSFKGCTKGRHSNVRPEPEPSSQESSNGAEKVPVSQISTAAAITTNGYSNNNDSNNQQSPIEVFNPPDPDLVEDLKIIESKNLASAPPVQNVVICKNCKAEESQLVDSVDSACLYHRGIQVFHDSLKYWSCCPHKKFTEFEEFQKLPPCAQSDRHQLMVKVDFKENWFQAGPTLTIAIYGLKGARLVEGKSVARLRGGRNLRVCLTNQSGIVIFEKEWNLNDYVVAGGLSKLLLNPSNVQIVLEKANKQTHWKELIQMNNGS